MENQEQIRQSGNEAFVVGRLKEKNINFKTYDGKLMASGYIVVATETAYGKGEVRISVMQNAQTKDGKENSLYKGLVTVANEYKSMKETGSLETADLVKVKGSIEDETYYNTNTGDFVEKVGIRATSIRRIDRISKSGETEEDRAVAILEGYIAEIKPVKEELEVKIVSVGYGGKAIPVIGYVEKDLVLPFQNMYQVGVTSTFNIAIVNTVEVEAVQKSVGFGQAVGEKIERTIVRNVIFGGENPNFNGYTQEQMSQAMALRQVALDNKKEKAINNKSKGGSMPTSGFGTSQGTAPVNTGFTAPVGQVPTFGGAQTGFPMPGANFGVK